MKTLRISRRIAGVQLSAIREILKVTERPDILSFAGGLPAPETFPVEAFARAYAEVFEADGPAALQYSTTEGYLPLREWLRARLARRGVERPIEQLLMTSGSQQGIDLVARALLDPGDVVIVESPSYLAAIQAFQACGATLEAVPMDEQGMRVDELERMLKQVRPKLIYTVPNFQNPSGLTLSFERRERLARAAKKHGVPVLEDDPYGELRYSGSALPPVAACDRSAPVVSLSTFSKTLSPGVRLGWLSAPAELVRYITVCKQAADLHTSSLAQRAIAKLLAGYDYEAHIERIRELYRVRRDVMLHALEQHFPPGTQWTTPDGGLFVWVQLPNRLRAEALLADAVAQSVAFVPGSPFFARRPRFDFIRLNFSNRPPELIEEGMRRLGSVVKKQLDPKAVVARCESAPRV